MYRDDGNSFSDHGLRNLLPEFNLRVSALKKIIENVVCFVPKDLKSLAFCVLVR